MQTTPPLKRHPSLQPLSREHHHVLLLAWKIRKGISKEVDNCRIEKYVDWFYRTYIIPHLTTEEESVYPILGNEHELIIKAKNEHNELKKFFDSEQKDQALLLTLAELLESHIRFEERTVFPFIQQAATEDQLQLLVNGTSTEKFVENNTDQFWI